MENLFSVSREYRDDFHRNIVSLRESEDLFDDINGGDPALSSLAQKMDMEIKANIPTGTIQRGFFYSASLHYPFEQVTASRYSDGSFGALYGSLDMETTIYETAHHMIRNTLGIEGVTGEIIRERAVYLIHCNAILLDLTSKGIEYPELLSEEYTFTQQIGKRVSSEGHPGLLVPSARKPGGINMVIFNPDVLNNDRINCYLIYHMHIQRRVVIVEREQGVSWFEISF